MNTSLLFPSGRVQYVEYKHPLRSTFRLSAFTAVVKFGEFHAQDSLRSFFDTTVGSGDDGMGGDDSLRFSVKSNNLIGGVLDFPLSNLSFYDLSCIRVKTRKNYRLYLLSNSIRVPKCKSMYFDIGRKTILCLIDNIDFDLEDVELVQIGEGLSLVFLDGSYKGYTVGDPLSLLLGESSETTRADYNVLSAFFWPHNDETFESILGDDDDMLTEYYRGLQRAFQHYFDTQSAQSKVIQGALEDALS